MASREDHVRQWRHNRLFLATIEPEFRDWMVTVAFYTALHAVSALLRHDGISVTSHEGRNNALLGTNRYQKIQLSYFPLYNLSRTVRYLAVAPSGWVSIDHIQSELVERRLYPIEKSVQKLTGLDLKLDSIQVRR